VMVKKRGGNRNPSDVSARLLGIREKPNREIEGEGSKCTESACAKPGKKRKDPPGDSPIAKKTEKDGVPAGIWYNSMTEQGGSSACQAPKSRRTGRIGAVLGENLHLSAGSLLIQEKRGPSCKRTALNEGR